MTKFRLRDFGGSAASATGAAPSPSFTLAIVLRRLARRKGKPPRRPAPRRQLRRARHPLDRPPDMGRDPLPACGKPPARNHTMDTFVDSSWYFARFHRPRADPSPHDMAEAESWCATCRPCIIGGNRALDPCPPDLLFPASSVPARKSAYSATPPRSRQVPVKMRSLARKRHGCPTRSSRRGPEDGRRSTLPRCMWGCATA